MEPTPTVGAADVRRCIATSAPGETSLLLRKLLLRERRPLLALLGASARVPIENLAYGGGRFRGTFEPPYAPERWPDHCEFLIPSRGALLSFQSSVAVGDGTVELGLPPRLTHLGFRSSFRGAGRVGSVAWRSAPSRPLLDARLEDVSLRGFSFVAPAVEPVAPGASLEVELTIPHATFRTTVTLTSVKRARGGAWLCGARLELDRIVPHVAWRDFVLHTVLPGVHVGGAELADDAWRVLDTSQYLRSWTSVAERHALAAQHREAWQRTPRAHGHLLIGRDAEGDGEASATVATHRIYSRTWLCHHLGADAGRSVKDRLELLHGMYRGLIHAGQHWGVEYLLIYNQQKDHWVDVVYGKFAEQYAAPGSLLFDGYRLFKLARPITLESSASDSWRVEDAEPRWSERVHEALADLSPLERDAFEYDDLPLSRFGGECARHGRKRARRVLVASRGSELLGGLVLELGEDGENVFGLMSRCSFLPGTSRSLDVRRSLLAAAANAYERAGVRQAVLLEHEGCEPDAYIGVGWQHVSLGVRWLAKLSELPVWLDYLEQTLGLRQGAGPAPAR